VPESVSDVVLARVGRLSRAGASALTAASVLGESFELPVLQALAEPGDLLDALDEASAAGLVDEVGGDRYRFAHALTRDAVYGALGQGRCGDLHRRAAAALEQVHGLEPGPELAAIALHLFAAGGKEDGERAVELAERAADWSLERKGYEQAVMLLTRALPRAAEGERRRTIARKRAIAFQRLTHAYLDV
jgi:predicted ATPase